MESTNSNGVFSKVWKNSSCQQIYSVGNAMVYGNTEELLSTFTEVSDSALNSLMTKFERKIEETLSIQGTSNDILESTCQRQKNLNFF
eukprot:12989618-Ditylum_brightwellii.AAC.1